MTKEQLELGNDIQVRIDIVQEKISRIEKAYLLNIYSDKPEIPIRFAKTPIENEGLAIKATRDYLNRLISIFIDEIKHLEKEFNNL